MKPLLIILLTLFGSVLPTFAESITYRIVDYNADAAAFTLAASGQRPVGSYAIFDNEFGATRGNRYNQIPRNKAATLWLMGWEGCTIERVTLWMCSNRSSGTAALEVTSGDATLFTMRAADFADPEAWFGRWVAKDHGVYVATTKNMTTLAPVSDDVAITLKGGTPEGSVYLDAVTIDYQPVGPVESPLGWAFEKLEAKGKIADGDVLMLYRSGDAAGDIDGMATSHYLDAIGLASTSNVAEPFVTTFTAHTTDDGHWTLTNQYGQQLGATSAQGLAWDAGVTTWDIALGYSGAEVSSTHTKYGTLRYNAPAESYARFWNYTSASLPLPYLYRRVRQHEPVVSNDLLLPDAERRADLAETDTLVLRAQLMPVTTTDRRLLWASSDETVATVASGIVFLHAPGQAIITASSADGGSTASCRVVVDNTAAAISTLRNDKASASPAYHLDGRRAARRNTSVTISSDGRKRID